MTTKDLSTHEFKSIKLTFILTESEQGPYPVSTESIWCDIEGDYFRIKNIPFFLEGVSFDDLISIMPEENHEVHLKEVIKPSSNSTLWINLQDPSKGRLVLENLRSIGCGVEGGVFPNYFAVNVPSTTSIDSVYLIIDKQIDSSVILVDYPSIRHE